MVASYKNEVAIVEYLCKHPSLCCINARDDKSGYTALHHASNMNYAIQVVKLLLEAVADPSIADRNGRTE